MPLPQPKSGEKKSDFISRCMVDLSDKEEFKDNKQRAAVCYSQFEEAESKASVVVSNEDDCTLFFSKASPDVSKHYFKTKEEALEDAKKMGLKGKRSLIVACGKISGRKKKESRRVLERR
jgi:hypothetical protein